MRIETYEDGGKLDFFRELYAEAQSAQDDLCARLERHLEQYKGSDKIDGSEVPARQVRNITYELIESQVTSYLPNPSVTPKSQSERNERRAKSIETLLRNKRDELPFEKLNDMDERYSPIYGGSIWLIEWDNSIVTQSTVGDVKISCLSPRRFVGQPSIYEIDDMEYCFIVFETTKEDIERKYGVPLSVAEETESDESTDDRTATLYVCYYKDDEDHICQYIWSGDTELLDIENYFARKRKVCRVCGRREELCRCEKPKLELQSEEYEELTRDLVLSDGRVIPAQSEVIRDGRPAMETVKQQAVEADGTPAFEDVNGVLLPLLMDTEVPKTEPTRLPFYTLKKFPIRIRRNTSEEGNLLGQSDCEFIRPQQQGINKLESRIFEKLMGAGVYPIVPEDYVGEVDNSIFKKVFRVKQSTANLYSRLDLQVSVSQDMEQAERLYDQAKRILGITDSFQGQHDSSAQSGKAKQLQIQQAAGRLDSKRQMKNAAYAEIDEIIFGYYLAYADEPRPATYRDADGRLQNRVFNRYDFLERDEAGEWYYNDQFLFRTDATVDIDRSRELLWQENRQNFQQGAYGDPAQPKSQLIFWQNMERAHYPWAEENVERIREEIAEQERMAAMQQQMAAMQQQMGAVQAENGQLRGEVQSRAEYEEYLRGMMKNTRGGM